MASRSDLTVVDVLDVLAKPGVWRPPDEVPGDTLTSFLLALPDYRVAIGWWDSREGIWRANDLMLRLRPDQVVGWMAPTRPPWETP